MEAYRELSGRSGNMVTQTSTGSHSIQHRCRFSGHWPPTSVVTDHLHQWSLTTYISDQWPPTSVVTDHLHQWSLTTYISGHWPPTSVVTDHLHQWSLTTYISGHWPPTSVVTDHLHQWSLTTYISNCSEELITRVTTYQVLLQGN